MMQSKSEESLWNPPSWTDSANPYSIDNGIDGISPADPPEDSNTTFSAKTDTLPFLSDSDQVSFIVNDFMPHSILLDQDKRAFFSKRPKIAESINSIDYVNNGSASVNYCAISATPEGSKKVDPSEYSKDKATPNHTFASPTKSMVSATLQSAQQIPSIAKEQGVVHPPFGTGEDKVNRITDQVNEFPYQQKVINTNERNYFPSILSTFEGNYPFMDITYASVDDASLASAEHIHKQSLYLEECQRSWLTQPINSLVCDPLFDSVTPLTWSTGKFTIRPLLQDQGEPWEPYPFVGACAIDGVDSKDKVDSKEVDIPCTQLGVPLLRFSEAELECGVGCTQLGACGIPLFPGQLIAYGESLTDNLATTESGQVLYVDSKKVALRKAQTVLIYSQSIIAVPSGEWIEKGTPLMALSYQKLVTGDIVQGLPKIEQFFEAPLLKDGTFWSDSLQAKLNQFFQAHREQLPLGEAVRKGFSEIQRVLVEGVQRVYISQGVLIADKHVEVIVRQMTCKGRILYSGDTGFLRNELVSLEKIESVNQVTYGQKALYHPQVRGITDASLESESFLSAASFQETTRVLSRDAVIGKTDLMRGLKERVIVGELVQAGTGLSTNTVYHFLPS